MVDIGVLEEDYSSEWTSPSFANSKKNGTIRVVTDFRKLNLFLKHLMSPISYSKDLGHDPFNGRVYFCFSIGLKYGYEFRIMQIQTLPNGYQDCLVPDFFKT
jgi:hypothetical protein